MNKYRIITFDGGGIRGALTVELLRRLERRCPGLIRSADLFAGTSTGSFIALGLAHGLPADDIAKLYSEENGKYIFTPSYLELFRPKYDNDHLKEVLTSVFPPDLRLKDLNRRVLVTSFNVSGSGTGNWSPVFFTNFPGSPTRNELVVDVALCSSAAPVYFPSHRHHIDGGVVANNPSTAAVCAAVDRHLGRQSLGRVYLLSMGTGSGKASINEDTTGWGAFEWMFYPQPPLPLLSIMFDGGVATDVLYTAQLLGSRYYRLNVQLPRDVSLDDYRKIPFLVQLAREFDIDSAAGWVKNNWFWSRPDRGTSLSVKACKTG